jgi:hypothetical protein
LPKFEELEKRVDGHEKRLDNHDVRINSLEKEDITLSGRIDVLCTKLDGLVGVLKTFSVLIGTGIIGFMVYVGFWVFEKVAN